MSNKTHRRTDAIYSYQEFLISTSTNRYETRVVGKKRDKSKEFNSEQKKKTHRGNKRSKQANNNKFRPHLGLETASAMMTELKDLSRLCNVEMSDSYISKVEDLIALLVSLRECTSLTQLSAIIFLYLKTHTDKSICCLVYDYATAILETLPFEPQSSEDPSWVVMLRNVHDNWGLAKSSRAFRQFTKLMNILVTIGICDASNLKFELAGFTIFDETMFKKHVNAFDLADALFSTVTYFIEGIYRCAKTGTFKPFLVSDFSMLEDESEYQDMLICWGLVENGNLEKVYNISENEFICRLNKLVVRLEETINTLSGYDKTLMTNNIRKLKQIKSDYVTKKVFSGLRKAPICLEFFGLSNQGKTTCADQMVTAMLMSAGLSTDIGLRASINSGDKFISNWDSNFLVAIFDDLANEKADFVEKSPNRSIIDFCNNSMYYAPKADLASKGKCFVEPEIVVITTNMKNLDAGVYGNCPYSIQRRADLVFTILCKIEFQRVRYDKDGVATPCGVDPAKVREHIAKQAELGIESVVDDIWSIDIERAVQPEAMTAVASYAPITWRGKVMVNVCMTEAINCAIEHYAAHRENQTSILQSMKTRQIGMRKCSDPGCKFIHGFCPDHKVPQVGVASFCTNIATTVVRNIAVRGVDRYATNFLTYVNSLSTSDLYALGANTFRVHDLMSIVPTAIMNNEYAQYLFYWYYRDLLKRNIIIWMLLLFTIFSFLTCTCGVLFSTGVLVLYFTFCTSMTISIHKRIILRTLSSRNGAIPEIVRNTRDRNKKAIFAACAGIGALYSIARMYKYLFKGKKVQGSLEPTTQEEISVRDAEVSQWATSRKKLLPTSNASKTTSGEDLSAMVCKNLRYASMDNGVECMMGNVLFVVSNVIIVPHHYFAKNSVLKLTCYQGESGGDMFKTIVDLKMSYHVPDTDLVLCYTATGGSRKDLTQFFPLTRKISKAPACLSYRFKSGSIMSERAMLEPQRTRNGVATFEGGNYKNLSVNTFAGMCGAVCTTLDMRPVIAGFHLGGITGKPEGCFGTISQDDVANGVEFLKTMPGFVLSGSGEHFNDSIMGVKITTAEPLHFKSPLNYLPHGTQVQYHGSCVGALTDRSDVRKTPISDAVAEVCGKPNVYGPPKMQPNWFGYQVCLENVSIPGSCFLPALLAQSVLDYSAPLVKLAASRLWNHMKPLDDHQNLNGIPGVRFIDAINLNTAIGYPLTGCKRKFVIELEPTKEKPNNRIFVPEIMEEITRVEDIYRKGERAYTVAKACKKDEALPVAKGKVRIFYGNSISTTWLIRKYFLPVIRMLQMNPLTSECAVGINSQGPEWDEFYKHSTKHGLNRLFGGDYGKYDQKLPSQLLLAAFNVLITLAAQADYTEEDLSIMRTLTGDVVYSLIAVNGDLISLESGTHISGNSLTVILNGICGSLNLRNFFFSIYPHDVKFRDAVAIMTYGDDNIGSVSPNFPLMNIKECSLYLQDGGQIYTMPDKESELTEYLKEGDFEFLKRTNVYHPELDCNIGALSENSIFKSLHCYLRPKGCVLTPQEACAQNIDGALRELFCHGEEIYERRRLELIEVAARTDVNFICQELDLSYAQRVNKWLEDYKMEPQSGRETDPQPVVAHCGASANLQRVFKFWLPVSPMLYVVSEKLGFTCSNRQRNARSYLGSDLPPNNVQPAHSVGALRAYIISPNKTNQNKSQWDYKPQSGVTGDQLLSRMMGDAKYQATTFSDQKPEYKVYVDNECESTRMLQDTDDASLADFFRRPIKVTTLDWGTGLTLAATVNPWNLYFNNPRVINRLANFNLMRCKLRLKVVVNGNSFQYGRAIMAYLPLPTFDAMSTNAALVSADLIGTTQLPKIYINPSESTGGEMELPFFWHRNYLNIPLAEWGLMGELYFRSLTPLKHANGATDRCSISLFVWAEDVHLSVLTSVEPSTIVPQSGVEVEQAATKGFVSGPATAIAKFASAASSIPGIAPYAIATNIAATATAALAKQFGYSRPPNVADPALFNPKSFSSLAVTNVPDAVNKLTIDSKQELSIDPRIAGMGSVDGMAIKEIAKRESYITQFTWPISATTETLLWNTRVTPMMWASTTTATDPAIHLTACAFAALPFEYWTGTIRLRFQIVSSVFHKGRLKFVYDPNFIATNEYNINYIDIVDLADKTDFTLEIGMGQRDTLLRHLYPGRNAVSEVYSNTAYASTDLASNGVLGVYVVNTLTTPNSTVNNDVFVNVYVSAGDDFEVFVPNEEVGYYTFKPQSGVEVPLVTIVEEEPSECTFTRYWIDCFQGSSLECLELAWTKRWGDCPFSCWRHKIVEPISVEYRPQSGVMVADSQNTDELDAPQQSETHQLGMCEQDTSNVNMVFTGESIQSFRTLLKRYNLHRSQGVTVTPATVLAIRSPLFPYYRGSVPGAIDLTAVSVPYTYCNTVMLQYVTSAFSGWRGSVRWKMLTAGGKAAGSYDTKWVERRNHAEFSNAYQFLVTTWGTATYKQSQRNTVIVNPPGLQPTGPPLGMSGIAATISEVNPNLEFEMPFYSKERFVPGKPINYTTGSGLQVDAYETYWQTQGDGTTTTYMYCAAGEDFQTYFYTGPPRIYYVVGATPA